MTLRQFVMQKQVWTPFRTSKSLRRWNRRYGKKRLTSNQSVKDYQKLWIPFSWPCNGERRLQAKLISSGLKVHFNNDFTLFWSWHFEAFFHCWCSLFSHWLISSQRKERAPQGEIRRIPVARCLPQETTGFRAGTISNVFLFRSFKCLLISCCKTVFYCDFRSNEHALKTWEQWKRRSPNRKKQQTGTNVLQATFLALKMTFSHRFWCFLHDFLSITTGVFESS